MTKNDFDGLLSVGIDFGNDVFHLVSFDCDRRLVFRRKVKRLALPTTFE